MTENFILRTWNTTPPITKTIATICITISLLVYIKAVSPFTLSYSTFCCFKQHQYWRLLTSFFYFGSLTLDNVLHIFFLCRYSRMLEDGFLFTSDYFIMLLFVIASIFVIGQIFIGYLTGYSMSLMSNALSATITYVWTRKNPNAYVQLLGCVVFQAFYLPFLVPVFGFLSERKFPIDDMIGIFVGHLFYFLKYVFPNYGFDILKTPKIVKKLFGEVVEEENNDKEENKNVKESSVVDGGKRDEEGGDDENAWLETSDICINDSSESDDKKTTRIKKSIKEEVVFDKKTEDKFNSNQKSINEKEDINSSESDEDVIVNVEDLESSDLSSLNSEEVTLKDKESESSNDNKHK